MILDKRLRALFLTGIFCLAAPVGGWARAAEVYPGCAVPPTTFNHVWYVDPVNGKTVSAGGLGTQAAPWNSLQAVFSASRGYKYPLLTTAPYVRNPTTGLFSPGPDAGPIQPGDEILVMSGNYGDIEIGSQYGGVNNSPAFVTIAASPGQAPVLTLLYIMASSGFVVSGLKVQSLGAGRIPLVSINSAGPTHPTSNIILHNLNVSSADPSVYATWTQAQWVANTRVGVSAKGSNNTTCVAVADSHITANHFGLEVFANNMLVSGNEIDHFGDDGIDYGASNILMTRNYIHESMDWKNGAHMDGMQGYPGAFTNVVIDSNRVIRQADPNLPFPNYLQGIDAFDGDWTNVTVTNNVVVTSACWGIFLSSVHGGRIVNNTVVADGLIPQPGNCKPLVVVGGKTHQGSPSNDVIIRNNIANGLNIDNTRPNMTMDHNICLGINGKCQIVTYVNGKLDWGTVKPGMHGDHNLIDARGASGMFVNFDPAKFVYDLRLRPQAPAIGVGNPAEAPRVDHTGAPRGSRVDVGAYQYGSDK
jgi:Right handed beta helix region